MTSGNGGNPRVDDLATLVEEQRQLLDRMRRRLRWQTAAVLLGSFSYVFMLSLTLGAYEVSELATLGLMLGLSIMVVGVFINGVETGKYRALSMLHQHSMEREREQQ